MTHVFFPNGEVVLCWEPIPGVYLPASCYTEQEAIAKASQLCPWTSLK